MVSYAQQYNQGKFAGVQRDDGANIPADPGNRDWQAFLVWNSSQQPPLDLSDIPPPVLRVPRLPRAIVADLALLTQPQQLLVLNDLNSGAPPKWELSASPVVWATAPTWRNTTGTIRQEALFAGVAFYCIESPSYLVHPIFDATINIPGDQAG